MSPCSTGLGSRALLFQGPQEAPPGVVWGGLGSGAGQGCRGGNSSPGEPKTGLCLTPGATPAPSRPASYPLLLGGLLLFLLAIPAPSTRALRCAAWTPKPGQPERNMGNHRPTQKRLWRGATSLPAGRPLTLASFTQDSLSAWSANTLPTLGRAPPHPWARK